MLRTSYLPFSLYLASLGLAAIGVSSQSLAQGTALAGAQGSTSGAKVPPHVPARPGLQPGLPPFSVTAGQPADQSVKSRSAGIPKTSAHRATVKFSDGLLAVQANNSSLNQILRDVAQVTGMKISGGVADERVFGSYGPGEPNLILTALLEGSGSNILLMQNSNLAPKELVLTPRRGGVSPPNPNAARDAAQEEADQDDGTDVPPEFAPQVSRRAQAPVPPTHPQTTQQIVNDALANPETQQQPRTLPQDSEEGAPASTQPDTPSTTPAPAAADTTTQQSPNGVKTPQQIYDELLKLQQQAPKTPNATSPQ